MMRISPASTFWCNLIFTAEMMPGSTSGDLNSWLLGGDFASQNDCLFNLCEDAQVMIPKQPALMSKLRLLTRSLVAVVEVSFGRIFGNSSIDSF